MLVYIIHLKYNIKNTLRSVKKRDITKCCFNKEIKRLINFFYKIQKGLQKL